MKRKFIIICLIFISCSHIFSQVQSNDIPSETNVKIFENTNAYELAKAVKNQSTSQIKKIFLLNPEYAFIEDPYYGYTVLHWAVGMEKYNSVKCLLELGVSPNIKSSETDMTPLYIASGISFKGSFSSSNTKILKLLLKYKADPNITIKKVVLPTVVTKQGQEINPHLIYSENSPLMAASSFEKIQLLVEIGKADVNYRKSNGTSILLLSLLNRDFDLSYYLLLDCNAQITQKEIDAFNRISIKENSKNYTKYLIMKELFKQNSLKK